MTKTLCDAVRKGRMSEEWLDDLKQFKTDHIKSFIENAPGLIIVFKHSYEKVENGDLNWTVPGKFISFSGPLNVTDKYGSFTPDDYVPIFISSGSSNCLY